MGGSDTKCHIINWRGWSVQRFASLGIIQVSGLLNTHGWYNLGTGKFSLVGDVLVTWKLTSRCFNWGHLPFVSGGLLCNFKIKSTSTITIANQVKNHF